MGGDAMSAGRLTIEATLGRPGMQLKIQTRSGATLYGDLFKPLDRDGNFQVLLWGTRDPMRLALADVTNANAADVQTHAEFVSIKTAQRALYQGNDR
jgi:hypothetical protein